MLSSALVTIPGKTETVLLPGGVPLQLIAVKGGTFIMGDDQSEYDHEKPAHRVQVRDFYLGKYPITNVQFTAFLNDYGIEKVLSGVFQDQFMIYEHEWGCQNENGHWVPSYGFEQHPVINVTWHGAYEFCKWLSINTAKQYHLPSETQWEYAARGGRNSLGFDYAGGHKLKEVAWYLGNSNYELKAVGLKYPNELCLYDMSGNVWEYCQDHWKRGIEHVPHDGSPWLVADKASNLTELRVCRGGGWNGIIEQCRVSHRYDFPADHGFSDVGFRVAR